MYLKNTSNTMCVTVNTIRGKVGIDPQEIVDIKYKDPASIATAPAIVSKALAFSWF